MTTTTVPVPTVRRSHGGYFHLSYEGEVYAAYMRQQDDGSIPTHLIMFRERTNRTNRYKQPHQRWRVYAATTSARQGIADCRRFLTTTAPFMQGAVVVAVPIGRPCSVTTLHGIGQVRTSCSACGFVSYHDDEQGALHAKLRHERPLVDRYVILRSLAD